MFDRLDDDLAARSLGALAQPHRLSAFRALMAAENDGLTPGMLCKQMGISPASMSFHLKELASVGLVNQRREGRYVIYRASFDRMRQLLDFLVVNCCAGHPCELSAPEHACRSTSEPNEITHLAEVTR